jgi:hypothetical protein
LRRGRQQQLPIALNAQLSASYAVKSHRVIMRNTEQYLIDTADQCTRLARAGREMAASLEAISNDLLAKAVELDTSRDKSEKRPAAARKSAAK